jgi:hypothetical protein
MALSRTDIMEAIKADLIRDQEEIQEIQQRLIALQERTRANRAWLKAYGFNEQTIVSAADIEPSEPLSDSIQLEHTVASALEIEESEVRVALETAPVVLDDAERPAQAGVLSDISSSPLKAEGRKKLYDALISRGARIS